MTEVARAAAAYRLCLPRTPMRGRVGDRSGRELGSSLDFVDVRDYLPGDDLRRIDWRVFARTDALAVRQHREEIAPEAELVVDTSARMAVTEAKAAALDAMVTAFIGWCRAAGVRPRLLAAGGGVLPGWRGDLPLDGPADRLRPDVGLRPRTFRIVLSDLLLGADPTPALRALAGDAAALVVVQLLDPWELHPTADGARTLVDAVGGATLDVQLDAATLRAYGARLARLQDLARGIVTAAGGRFVVVAADAPEVMFRQALLPAGIVEPA